MQKNINGIIADRRSIYPKEFTGKILDNSIIEILLSNANQAPNHNSNYPWRFIVISGQKMNEWLNKAAEIYKNNTIPEKFKQDKLDKILNNVTLISHAIGIVLHRDKESTSIEIEDICAIACGVQNMYLSLDQYANAGGYWSTGLGTYSEEMHKFLELENEEKLLGYFILGDIAHKRTEGHKKDYKKFVKYL